MRLENRCFVQAENHDKTHVKLNILPSKAKAKRANMSQSATLQNYEIVAISDIVVLHLFCCIFCEVCNAALSNM